MVCHGCTSECGGVCGWSVMAVLVSVEVCVCVWSVMAILVTGVCVACLQGRGSKKAGKRSTTKKGSKKAGGTRSKSGKASSMMIRGDDLSQKIYQTMDKHKEVCVCVNVQLVVSAMLNAASSPPSGVLCGSAEPSLSV